MKHNEEMRDPRIDPRRGDSVAVDMGDGDRELRYVLGVEHHTSGKIVKCHVDGDTQHTRGIRLADWRELADDSTVLERGG